MSILYQFIRSLKTLQLHEMPVIMWSFNSGEFRCFRRTGRDTERNHSFIFLFWRVFVIFGLFIRCHFNSIHIHLFAIDVLISSMGNNKWVHLALTTLYHTWWMYLLPNIHIVSTEHVISIQYQARFSQLLFYTHFEDKC